MKFPVPALLQSLQLTFAHSFNQHSTVWFVTTLIIYYYYAVLPQDSLFTDLSSNLIPTMCKTHTDQEGCAKKIGTLLSGLSVQIFTFLLDGLLKIGKTPVTNVFKRMGILLDCEELSKYQSNITENL